jgi:hypothetical protein
MSDERHEPPTERTPQGYEVPIPERREFFGNLRKAADPEKPSQPSGGERESSAGDE